MQKNSVSHIIQIPQEWPLNNIYLVEIDQKKIAISRLEGKYYAFSDTCPHGGVSLSEKGFLVKNCIIVCPLHSYKFNIKNGRNITEEGYKLKTYTITQIPRDQLEIELY